MHKKTAYVLMALACVLLVAGCAGKGWRIRWGAPPEEQTAAAEETAAEPVEQTEEALRALVEKEVRAEERRGGPDNPDLVRLRPYYQRQYVEFPGGAESFEVAIQDTDSRTSPMRADVRIDKVRHATRLQRDRKAAQADDNFFRSTGVEVITYEYRLGRWRRLGSTFVASRTEEQVNGQWVEVRPEERSTGPAEPRPGWMKRTFGFITGG